MTGKRPYVICHMASTINGKILSVNWGQLANTFSGVYERCHGSFESQAWMCGRVTMEKDFSMEQKPELSLPEIPIARIPFIGDRSATSFAIAIDGYGKLGWVKL